MIDNNLLNKADNGDVSAILTVAAEYYCGENIDIDKSIFYLKKAVSLGNSKAVGYLKSIYAEHPSNYNWLEHFLLDECSKNNIIAINALVYMYKSGSNVEKNIEKALSLLLKGVDLKSGWCINYLAGCYFEGLLGLPVNEQLAIYYLNEGYKIGYAPSIYFLSNCYAEGDGVEKNLKISFNLVKEAAEKGLPDAQYQLFINYRNGIGINADFDKAYYWLNKAAENGQKDAIRFIEG